MTDPVAMTEIRRGPFVESRHLGHAVICDGDGQIVRAWGDAQALIYPRSSCKMIQALPLVSSGAADRFGLGGEHLALACASHNGAAIHTDRVRAWLDRLGLDDAALRCGPQMPDDTTERNRLIRARETPCQYHNNCSGKHCGFLTLARHMGAGPEYVEIDHPVQQAALAAFEETTGLASPGYGIDGCSAPNFATSLQGLARAMARFAGATGDGDRRDRAMHRLTRAMAAHPVLVAGEGRSCTALMRAMEGRASVKTGAEAVFVAIVPEARMGIAVKIEDGGTRASEAVTTQLLVGLGLLAADHPVATQYTSGPIRNWDGLETGHYRPVESLRTWRV